MAKASRAFVCQACGAVTSRWSGKCASCGEWNSHHRGDRRRPAPLPSIAIRGGKARLAVFETLAAGEPRGAAPSDRHCRARPRARRRPRAGLGRAGRRRSRHRQVDAPAAGGGRACRDRRPRRLSLRRGGAGPGAHAGGAAWARRSARRARHRDQPRQYRRHARQRRAARSRRHRFGADAVVRERGSGARHHLTAARLRLGADQPRQGQRLDAGAGRPRHQGRPDRRPQGHRAHGRYRALFRGLERPPVPHLARGEESIRRRPTRSACSRCARTA